MPKASKSIQAAKIDMAGGRSDGSVGAGVWEQGPDESAESRHKKEACSDGTDANGTDGAEGTEGIDGAEGNEGSEGHEGHEGHEGDEGNEGQDGQEVERRMGPDLLRREKGVRQPFAEPNSMKFNSVSKESLQNSDPMSNSKLSSAMLVMRHALQARQVQLQTEGRADKCQKRVLEEFERWAWQMIRMSHGVWIWNNAQMSSDNVSISFGMAFNQQIVDVGRSNGCRAHAFRGCAGSSCMLWTSRSWQTSAAVDVANFDILIELNIQTQ